ncbi:unnamed protein product [Caenorhabditis brenneri]
MKEEESKNAVVVFCAVYIIVVIILLLCELWKRLAADDFSPITKNPVIGSTKLEYEPANSSTASWNETSASLENREQILPENFPTKNWTGKYCGTLQRDVMTETSNGAVYHKEWNNMLSVMTIEKCVECSKNDQPPAYTSLFME